MEIKGAFVNLKLFDMSFRCPHDEYDNLTKHQTLRVLEKIGECVSLMFIGLGGWIDGVELAHFSTQRYPNIHVIVTSGLAVTRRLPVGVKFMPKPWLPLDILPFGTLPTGVTVVDGCDSATLTGSLVTINVPVMPSGYIHKITLDLLFACARVYDYVAARVFGPSVQHVPIRPLAAAEPDSCTATNATVIRSPRRREARSIAARRGRAPWRTVAHPPCRDERPGTDYVSNYWVQN
jgi:hypothetical protein